MARSREAQEAVLLALGVAVPLRPVYGEGRAAAVVEPGSPVDVVAGPEGLVLDVGVVEVDAGRDACRICLNGPH